MLEAYRIDVSLTESADTDQAENGRKDEADSRRPRMDPIGAEHNPNEHNTENTARREPGGDPLCGHQSLRRLVFGLFSVGQVVISVTFGSVGAFELTRLLIHLPSVQHILDVRVRQRGKRDKTLHDHNGQCNPELMSATVWTV